jgi:LPXTG-motif cell wall-anchored protein
MTGADYFAIGILVILGASAAVTFARRKKQ